MGGQRRQRNATRDVLSRRGTGTVYDKSLGPVLSEERGIIDKLVMKTLPAETLYSTAKQCQIYVAFVRVGVTDLDGWIDEITVILRPICRVSTHCNNHASDVGLKATVCVRTCLTNYNGSTCDTSTLLPGNTGSSNITADSTRTLSADG